VKTPLPKDNPLIYLFVVGGVSAADLSDIRRVLKQQLRGSATNHGLRIIVGSNGIWNSARAFDVVFHREYDE